MSEGFENENTKSYSTFEREIESKALAKKLGGQIVGNVQAKWGRIEIIKKSPIDYQLVIIKSRPYSVKTGPVYGDFKQALDWAHYNAQYPNANLKKRLDIFTDDYSSPSEAFKELPYGADARKNANPYQAPHDDFVPEADMSFKLAAAGKAKDQEELDKIDEEQQLMESGIKPIKDQFPGGRFMEMEKFDEEKHNVSMLDVMNKLTAGVDEKVWNEAKEKSVEEYGKVKWPFVNFLYDQIKGKK